jgi:hypothetical protein
MRRSETLAFSAAVYSQPPPFPTLRQYHPGAVENDAWDQHPRPDLIVQGHGVPRWSVVRRDHHGVRAGPWSSLSTPAPCAETGPRLAHALFRPKFSELLHRSQAVISHETATWQLCRLEIATVPDWIKLATLSLLISIAITAIFATGAFAVWWGFIR